MRTESEIWGGLLRITECDCDTVGLRVTGAIDLKSHNDWEHALWEVTDRCDEVHPDLTELTFIDVRGAIMLVDIASHSRDGQRIVVLGAPPGLQRVLQVLWPDGTAAIEGES